MHSKIAMVLRLNIKNCLQLTGLIKIWITKTKERIRIGFKIGKKQRQRQAKGPTLSSRNSGNVLSLRSMIIIRTQWPNLCCLLKCISTLRMRRQREQDGRKVLAQRTKLKSKRIWPRRITTANFFDKMRIHNKSQFRFPPMQKWSKFSIRSPCEKDSQGYYHWNSNFQFHSITNSFLREWI